MHERVHLTQDLCGQVFLCIEALHAPAEAHWKGTHIEPRNGANATVALQYVLPRSFQPAADRGNDAKACNDDASPGQAITSEMNERLNPIETSLPWRSR